MGVAVQTGMQPPATWHLFGVRWSARRPIPYRRVGKDKKIQSGANVAWFIDVGCFCQTPSPSLILPNRILLPKCPFHCRQMPAAGGAVHLSVHLHPSLCHIVVFHGLCYNDVIHRGKFRHLTQNSGADTTRAKIYNAVCNCSIPFQVRQGDFAFFYCPEIARGSPRASP